MADGRKRGKRRSYLNDFVRSANGKYVYTGVLHTFHGESASYRQAMGRLWILTGAMLIAVVAAGCVPAAGMQNCAYVLLPYAGSVLAVASVVWLMCRLQAGGESLRDYVYRNTVERFKIRGGFVVAFSGVSLGGQLLYVCLHGVGKMLPGTVAFWVCQGIVVSSAIRWKIQFLRLRWEDGRDRTP